MKLLSAAVLVCLAAAIPAEAQIYSWRDASGNLVLSNKPRIGSADGMTTYAVPGPTLIRTTTKPVGSTSTSRYDDLIQQHSTTHGISPDLVRAVIQAESGFNPRAISPKGAMGLMQLMPATARELGVNDPFQPGDNIRGGVTYLARLMTRFKQNVELALAAYNAGPASVDKYGGTVPPYRETRDYVRKITAKPGVAMPATPPPPPVTYKWIELVDGRPTTRYSNVAPKGIAYQTIGPH
jgi:soluble lytic murein transglycosylase-like protein